MKFLVQTWGRQKLNLLWSDVNRKPILANMHSKFSFFVTVFFTTSFSIFRMKVHEKLLTHYLSCTSPVDKEGYLNKKVSQNFKHVKSLFKTTGSWLVLLPDRKWEPPPSSGAGSFWRPTCSSTRSVRLTGTCWGSSCWKAVRYAAWRLKNSLLSPWCSDLGSKRTRLRRRIVKLKRAGWKRWCQRVTVTCPCWWRTWRGSMKVGIFLNYLTFTC